MAKVVKPTPHPLEELVARIKALELQVSQLQRVKSATTTTTSDGV